MLRTVPFLELPLVPVYRWHHLSVALVVRIAQRQNQLVGVRFRAPIDVMDTDDRIRSPVLAAGDTAELSQLVVKPLLGLVWCPAFH